jgi:hypothetical protein
MTVDEHIELTATASKVDEDKGLNVVYNQTGKALEVCFFARDPS